MNTPESLNSRQLRAARRFAASSPYMQAVARADGFLMDAIEVGAVVPCPACGGMIVVHDVLVGSESSRAFSDADVPCDECGARFDVEWEAMRTVGDSRRWSASVTSVALADA